VKVRSFLTPLAPAIQLTVFPRSKRTPPAGATVVHVRTKAADTDDFLKAHRQIEEQGTMIAQQQKQIEALTAGLQNVSAQLEMGKTAPQTVLNNE